MIDVPLAIVAAPPFSVVLATTETTESLPYMDTGAWLKEATGQRRPTTIQIPLVDIGTDGTPEVITYERLAAAKAS